MTTNLELDSYIERKNLEFPLELYVNDEVRDLLTRGVIRYVKGRKTMRFNFPSDEEVADRNVDTIFRQLGISNIKEEKISDFEHDENCQCSTCWYLHR